MRIRWLIEDDKNNTIGGSTDTNMYQRSISSRYNSVRCQIDTNFSVSKVKTKLNTIMMGSSSGTEGDRRRRRMTGSLVAYTI